MEMAESIYAGNAECEKKSLFFLFYLTWEHDNLHLIHCEASIQWQDSSGQMGIKNLKEFLDRLECIIFIVKGCLIYRSSLITGKLFDLIKQQNKIFNIQNKIPNIKDLAILPVFSLVLCHTFNTFAIMERKEGVLSTNCFYCTVYVTLQTWLENL